MGNIPLGPLIAIMPGQNPLRLPSEFDCLVAKFHQEHGELPTVVVLPRELRPGEALSWAAYFTRAGSFDMGRPDTSASPGAAKGKAALGGSKRAKTPSRPGADAEYRPGRKGRPATTTRGVDSAITQLARQGLGCRRIAEALGLKGIQVSPRTVARRLRVSG